MKFISSAFDMRACLAVAFWLMVAGCSRDVPESGVPSRPVRTDAESGTSTTTAGSPVYPAKTKVLADVQSARVPGSAASPPKTLPIVTNLFSVIFDEQGRSVAYVMEEADGVRAALDERMGRRYQAIGFITLSPDGRHLVYSGFDGAGWHMVRDHKARRITGEFGGAVFSPDSQHVGYDLQENGRWTLVVDDREIAVFPDGYSCKDKFFSQDSRSIVSIEASDDKTRPLRVVVTDLSSGRQKIREIQGTTFVYNKDKTRMAAVSEKDGKQRVQEFGLDRIDTASEGQPYEKIVQLAYGSDGVSLAYLAERDGERHVVFAGREERIPKTDGILSMVVRPDHRGVGLLLGGQGRVYLRQAFQTPSSPDREYMDAGELVYSGDASRYAYIAAQGKGVFMVVNGQEGPAFDRIVTPAFSPDGRFLVYRARKDGKRFVVVADADGRVRHLHPPYELVYDVKFSRDGRTLGYGVKDGSKLVWVTETL